MIDTRLADHALGLELELVELNHRRDVAVHDGWEREVDELDRQIEAAQVELAATAERLATVGV